MCGNIQSSHLPPPTIFRIALSSSCLGRFGLWVLFWPFGVLFWGLGFLGLSAFGVLFRLSTRRLLGTVTCVKSAVCGKSDILPAVCLSAIQNSHRAQCFWLHESVLTSMGDTSMKMNVIYLPGFAALSQGFRGAFAGLSRHFRGNHRIFPSGHCYCLLLLPLPIAIAIADCYCHCHCLLRLSLLMPLPTAIATAIAYCYCHCYCHCRLLLPLLLPLHITIAIVAFYCHCHCHCH